MKTVYTLRRQLNIVVAVCVFGAWLLMITQGGDGLSSTGLASMRFYTVLSNLLEGIAAICWLVRPNKKSELLKYIAAASVTVTFLTVVCFLGPIIGFSSMYTGANLFFHLIVPVVVLIESVFIAHVKFTARENGIVVIPTAIYGLVYLLNNLINGTGTGPNSNDWYGFLNWGYPTGLAIFAVVIFISWLAGFIIRKVAR